MCNDGAIPSGKAECRPPLREFPEPEHWMDGYEVARRLRQQALLNGVKLIAITGYGRESDLLRSQEARFDHHLVKPVNPLKLLELLATFTALPSPA